MSKTKSNKSKRSSKSKNEVNIKQLMMSVLILAIIVGIEYVFEKIDNNNNIENNIFGKSNYANLVDVPEYTDEICVMINDNKPYFTDEDYNTNVFENYSELDYLGRCGIAYANICKEIMPPEGDERGDISSVHPTRMETN